jgi:hypothetical protein
MHSVDHGLPVSRWRSSDIRGLFAFYLMTDFDIDFMSAERFFAPARKAIAIKFCFCSHRDSSHRHDKGFDSRVALNSVIVDLYAHMQCLCCEQSNNNGSARCFLPFSINVSPHNVDNLSINQFKTI